MNEGVPKRRKKYPLTPRDINFLAWVIGQDDEVIEAFTGMLKLTVEKCVDGDLTIKELDEYAKRTNDPHYAAYENWLASMSEDELIAKAEEMGRSWGSDMDSAPQ